MKRREFLQLSGLSGLSGVAVWLAQLGWPVHVTAVEEAPADNSDKPLIAIPFPIAARGEIAPPPEQHRVYIPIVSVSKGD